MNMFTFTEPEMADLLDVVIPVIKAEWEDVGHRLRFGIHEIDTIDEKHKSDPYKCCRELLKDWLRSNRGVNPKNWCTLINVIGKIPHLTAAKETIIKELEKLV